LRRAVIPLAKYRDMNENYYEVQPARSTLRFTAFVLLPQLPSVSLSNFALPGKCRLLFPGSIPASASLLLLLNPANGDSFRISTTSPLGKNFRQLFCDENEMSIKSIGCGSADIALDGVCRDSTGSAHSLGAVPAFEMFCRALVCFVGVEGGLVRACPVNARLVPA